MNDDLIICPLCLEQQPETGNICNSCLENEMALSVDSIMDVQARLTPVEEIVAITAAMNSVSHLEKTKGAYNELEKLLKFLCREMMKPPVLSVIKGNEDEKPM